MQVITQNLLITVADLVKKADKSDGVQKYRGIQQNFVLTIALVSL